MVYFLNLSSKSFMVFLLKIVHVQVRSFVNIWWVNVDKGILSAFI